MRDGTESFTGEDMKSGTSGSQAGLLEVLCYLIAIVVVAGSVWGGWDLSMPLALVMLVVLYAMLRDVSALTRLKTQNGPAKSPETKIPLQKVMLGERSQPQPPPISPWLGETRKPQESVSWVRQSQHTIQKGTTHEIIG
jgi:hypothetical protein